MFLYFQTLFHILSTLFLLNNINIFLSKCVTTQRAHVKQVKQRDTCGGDHDELPAAAAVAAASLVKLDVLTPENGTITLEIPSDACVRDLQKLLYTKTGIRQSIQCIGFSADGLHRNSLNNPNRTLKSCGIGNGATLKLVTARGFGGGGKGAASDEDRAPEWTFYYESEEGKGSNATYGISDHSSQLHRPIMFDALLTAFRQYIVSEGNVVVKAYCTINGAWMQEDAWVDFSSISLDTIKIVAEVEQRQRPSQESHCGPAAAESNVVPGPRSPLKRGRADAPSQMQSDAGVDSDDADQQPSQQRSRVDKDSDRESTGYDADAAAMSEDGGDAGTSSSSQDSSHVDDGSGQHHDADADETADDAMGEDDDASTCLSDHAGLYRVGGESDQGPDATAYEDEDMSDQPRPPHTRRRVVSSSSSDEEDPSAAPSAGVPSMSARLRGLFLGCVKRGKTGKICVGETLNSTAGQCVARFLGLYPTASMEESEPLKNQTSFNVARDMGHKLFAWYDIAPVSMDDFSKDMDQDAIRLLAKDESVLKYLFGRFLPDICADKRAGVPLPVGLVAGATMHIAVTEAVRIGIIHLVAKLNPDLSLYSTADGTVQFLLVMGRSHLSWHLQCRGAQYAMEEFRETCRLLRVATSAMFQGAIGQLQQNYSDDEGGVFTAGDSKAIGACFQTAALADDAKAAAASELAAKKMVELTTWLYDDYTDDAKSGMMPGWFEVKHRTLRHVARQPKLHASLDAFMGLFPKRSQRGAARSLVATCGQHIGEAAFVDRLGKLLVAYPNRLHTLMNSGMAAHLMEKGFFARFQELEAKYKDRLPTLMCNSLAAHMMKKGFFARFQELEKTFGDKLPTLMCGSLAAHMLYDNFSDRFNELFETFPKTATGLSNFVTLVGQDGFIPLLLKDTKFLEWIKSWQMRFKGAQPQSGAIQTLMKNSFFTRYNTPVSKIVTSLFESYSKARDAPKCKKLVSVVSLLGGPAMDYYNESSDRRTWLRATMEALLPGNGTAKDIVAQLKKKATE